MGHDLEQGTGSPLLGAELRRLRGGRTLQEVADLTRSPAVRTRLLPLSESLIAQMEGGKASPGVDSLHALSVIYRVSPQRLYDLIASERESRTITLPDTSDETLAAYNTALRESRWPDAIALALRGEALAATPTERVVWRARRGSCLAYTGRNDEAILVLTECLNSTHLGRHRRFQILRNLADVYAVAGYMHSAVECARQALVLCPDDVSDSTRAAVMAGLVSSLLAKQNMQGEPDADEVSEALRVIAHARALHVEPDAHWDLFLDLNQALALQFQGLESDAAREFASIARRAAAHKEDRLRMIALLNLGMLRHGQGRLEHAERHLLRALASALHLKQVNETFEIYVELMLIAKETSHPQYRHYLERCRHYYPLVKARTPGMVRFEEMDRGVA